MSPRRKYSLHLQHRLKEPKPYTRPPQTCSLRSAAPQLNRGGTFFGQWGSQAAPGQQRAAEAQLTTPSNTHLLATTEEFKSYSLHKQVSQTHPAAVGHSSHETEHQLQRGKHTALRSLLPLVEQALSCAQEGGVPLLTASHTPDHLPQSPLVIQRTTSSFSASGSFLSFTAQRGTQFLKCTAEHSPGGKAASASNRLLSSERHCLPANRKRTKGAP